MRSRLSHAILKLYYSRNHKKFQDRRNSLKSSQEEILFSLAKNLSLTEKWQTLADLKSYDDFVQKVPVSDYADYQDLIAQQRSTKKSILCTDVVRYEPTSGSTNARKWIPYSKSYLREINNAASVWLGSVYNEFPGVRTGTHYWSLSWLPEDLRSQTSSDDSELFPWYQRFVIQGTMAASPQIALLKHPPSAWWATLVSLCGKEDLSLISVWSPTFLIKAVEDIKANWSEIQSALKQGRWGRFESEILTSLGPAPRRQLSGEFDLKKLWPSLSLISAWDSSTSESWALQIKELFPDTAFQGKGLWATEGVVTIPFEEKKALAYLSHFYEFRDLETSVILPSWQLEKGRTYQPVISTASGLLRYQLQDRLKVVDHYGDVPCFEFLGRLRSTDMVGEKMDAAWVTDLFSQNPDWNAIALIAVRQPHAHYVLLTTADIEIPIETRLLENHHYRVARELGQLQPAKLLRCSSPLDILQSLQKSQLAGQNKIEILFEAESL